MRPAARFSATTTSERVPCLSGSALKLGTSITVNCGVTSGADSSTMNRWRANKLCHAYSVITRTGTRYGGSAPAKQSRTNTSFVRSDRSGRAEALRRNSAPEDGWDHPGNVPLAARFFDEEL